MQISLKNNTIWNFIGSSAPMLIGLISIPFLIGNIGIEKFGILTLIWSLIGYFSIFDFGIGRALTYQISSSLSKNSQVSLDDIIRSGLKFMLFTGILGGIILASSSKKLGFVWLNTTPNMHQEAFDSILLASLAIPITTYTSGLKGVLEGFEDFKIVNILKMILGILNFGFPVVTVLLLGNSLYYIVISLILSRVIVFILHIKYVNDKISLLKILKSKSNDKKTSAKLISFGAWMTLSNITSPLMVTADRFIISFILGASAVAYYTVPFDMVIRLLVIPASLTGVLFPRFSNLLVSDIDQVVNLFKKSKKIIFLVMLIISVLIICFSYIGLSFWINKELADKSWLVMSILSIGLLFNSLAQVPYALIQASGKVKLTSIIHLSEFAFYMIILFILLKYFGIVGAALAFVIRVFVDFIILNHFSKKIININ